MSEINEGVRILVERMKTNPEEFFGGAILGKWHHVLATASAAKWLTKEEHDMIDAGLNEVYRSEFTAMVLTTLTENPMEQAMQANERKRVTVKSLGTLTNASITGGTILSGTAGLGPVDLLGRQFGAAGTSK